MKNSNRIQENIGLLNYMNIGSEEYSKLYEKILSDLVVSKELYSLIRKDKVTNSESKDGKDIFCGLNSDKIPSVWIFTEESIAKEFASYYKMIANGQYLYRRVEIEELTVFIFNAMFSGVSKLIVDEGRNTLITNVYDFVNISLASINKEPILEKQEYKVMDVFNQMKYGKRRLYVIPSKIINGEELIYSKFTPVKDDKTVRIYDSEEKCKKESIVYGFEKEFAISMELRSLYKILENSYKEKIENVIFEIDDCNINMDIKKVIWILQRMM